MRIISTSLFTLSTFYAITASAIDKADVEKAFNDPNVIKLTPSNFEEAIKSETPILVEFYANWCGHCKNLAPEYAQAAEGLKKDGVKVASVDCTNHQDFCGKQDVQGYPTLRVYKKSEYRKYEGSRKADGIIKYMKKQLLPSVSKINLEKLVEFSRADDVVIVGNFVPGSKEAETFHKVAAKLDKDFTFGELENPGVIMFKKFDDGFSLFTGDVKNEEELTKFIQKQSIPLMDEIGPDNYMRYYESKTPLAFFFWSDKENHRTKYGPLVEESLKEHRDKVNAVYIDANTYGAHAERLNLEKNKWPALVIHDTEKDLKYTFSGKEFSKESIAAFFDEFVKGTLKPKYKSEPIPEKNDGPVIEIVHDTFNKIVGDNKKDVFLEIYAPWCGFCKKLAPTYEKIAKAYSKAKGGDKVVLAKFDGSKNDIPKEYGFKLEGFPTLVLYKGNTAGKDGIKQSITYDGDNTEEDLVKFLEENMTNKVKIELPTEEPEKETKEEL